MRNQLKNATIPRLRILLRRRRTWSALGFLIIMLGIIVYVLYSTLRGDTLNQIMTLARERLQPLALLQLSAIYAIILIFTSFVWMLIIGTFSGIWNWLLHFRLYALANIARRLPGSIWHVVGRIAAYERLGVPRAMIILASGVEFAAIIVGGIVATLVTLPFMSRVQQISPFWFIGGLALGAVLLNPMLLRRLIKRLSRQQVVTLRYRDLLTWVLLYALVWAVGGVLLFAVTTVIHPLEWALLPAIIGVWSMSGLVAFLTSFIPFGLGVTELAITALLSNYIPMPEALLVALFMRVLLTVNEVLWAAICGLSGMISGRSDAARALEMQRKAIPHSDAEKPDGVSQIIPLPPAK